MIVRVRLFAILRERAGASELELALPDGASVGEALDHLAELAGGLPLVLAVNRTYAQPSQILAPGDELALIPPVSGGAPAPARASGGGGAPARVKVSAEPLSADAI
ncbi:MAG: MoaD/ThiS family protein, partial [Solirubrobacteraceae bacterium]